ncbi:MAG: Lon protease-like protein [Pirellulaceae bacterium]|jgi:Lon protease-like protein
MSINKDSTDFPVNFSGVVRLFPLPNVVLFPHVMQPLRIFEPRYCEMLEDAMRDDQLIAMTLLQPGWENQYDEQPEVSKTLCVGRVISHARDDDGDHKILLLGVRRATIEHELPSDEPYRKAKVSLIDDYYPATGSSARGKLHHELIDCFEQLLPECGQTLDQLGEFATGQIPLGILSDIISFTIDMDLPIKQALLTERNVDVRVSMLLECLRSRLENHDQWDERPFPPKFSLN